MMISITFSIIYMISCFSVLKGDFTDCSFKRCCKSINNLDVDQRLNDCQNFGLNDCINNNLCEWDCHPVSTNKLKNNGYTQRRFKKLSKGNGIFRDNVVETGDRSKKGKEAENIDEYIKYTSIERMDECGVVYQYHMNENNARKRFRKEQNALLIRRLLNNDDHDEPRRLGHIFGTDDRIQINDLTDNTEWAGILEFSGGSGGFCSATLISNKFIITAAHCVYSLSSNEWFSGFYFHPDTIGNNSYNLHKIGHNQVFTFSGYNSHETEGTYPGDYDIAWIELDTEINFGYLGLGLIESNQTINENINIIGYPRDKPFATKWYQNCAITHQNESRSNGALSEFYSNICDGASGQSGAPAYTNNNEIIGIYWGGYDDRSAFSRITPWKHSSICAAMDDYNECKSYKQTYPSLCCTSSTKYDWIIVGQQYKFEFTGKYNGKPYYKNSINNYLFYDGPDYKWIWGPELGGDYYAYTNTEQLDSSDGSSWNNQEINLSRTLC